MRKDTSINNPALVIVPIFYYPKVMSMINLIIVLCFVTACDIQASVIARGTCGKTRLEDIRWELSDDGVLSFKGVGMMSDFDYGTAPWVNYKLQIQHVNMDDRITSVGDFAFFECYNLKSVYCSDSLTKIGRCSFAFCMNLLSFNLPYYLIEIGEEALFQCRKIKKLNIPQTLERIGGYAFWGVDSLKHLYIPASVHIIGENALPHVPIIVDSSNSSYRSIDDILYSKDGDTLFYCALTRQGCVSIPDGVRYICDNAFASCKGLEAIVLPSSTLSIGTSAFDDCINLRSVEIPDSVLVLESYSFSGCTNLKDIKLGVNVREVSPTAFDYCQNISKIEVDKNNKHFESIDGSLYTNGGDTLVVCRKNAVELSISPSCKKLAYHSVAYSMNLERVIIPASVTEISKNAFLQCLRLTEIYIENKKARSTYYTLNRTVNAPPCKIYVPKGTRKRYVKRGLDRWGDIIEYNNNIRKVVKSDGTVVQSTSYYPFGSLYVGSSVNSGIDVQMHKYTDKEYDPMHGLNLYDFSNDSIACLGETFMSNPYAGIIA